MTTANRFDAIVVGAGFAGATAARELSHAGYRCLVLEARDRLGGLTRVEEWRGQRLEHGGTWVSWRQPHVWAEVTRYGFTLTKDPRPERFAMPAGERVQWHAPAEALSRLNSLFQAFFQGIEGAIEDPNNPLQYSAKMRELDQYSLAQWFEHKRFSPDDYEWLVSMVGLGCGSLSSALTHLLRMWVASGRNFESLFQTWTHFRIKEGTDGLINAIAGDARADIRLNSPVSKISQDASGATVTTRNGEVFSAAAVIVAVPVQNWVHLEFSPDLSPAHREFSISSLKPGRSDDTKVFALIEGDTRPFFLIGGEHYPVPAMWTVKVEDGRQTVIAFYSSEAQMRSVLVEVLPDAKLIDVKVTHNYVKDEFSLGHPDVKPGYFTKLDPITQFTAPNGRLVFASSCLAKFWSHYIDGAIESGLTAAGQAKQVLRNAR